MDEASKNVIRIRTGESHDGWMLRSIHRRAAGFEKNHQETTLVLPTPGFEQPGLSAGGAVSKMGVCGNDRNVAGTPQNCVPAAAPILPVSAPTTRSAHKIRQDILSIGANN
jgi:hypothetical protein